MALCVCLVLYIYLQKDPTDQTCVGILSASCITPRHLNSSLVVAARLRKRRDRVKKACREEHYPNTFSITLRWLKYASSHNLFVCSPPKVASTTWLRHLYNMAGLNPSTDQIRTSKWMNKVSAM
ncbi:hypothetical protein Pmani_036448 [Petrolisthes manimaculis]|uniref:Carbohydrate sulfotransferase n=1 Tax=Petrolisthes manimaculis TaxID=1843537 RepID=A0AAE1NIF5_9EUCA|nr:hypothetical protein Pmani_036448 [Petrolisthes manimaculis]